MSGARNLLTDIANLRVGHAADERLASGVTAVVCDEPAIAAVFAPGGGPALRDTALLEPEMTVERVDAIVLSGGSALGLDAATGAQAWLREKGRGFPVRSTTVPIVPSAACFDLLNGGDKVWGRFPPYRELAYAACEAAGLSFELGTAGAGFGATTADLKGGIGSASARTPSGFTVGALVVANSIGSAVVGGGPHFWAAPWEENGEFGGLGPKPAIGPDDLALRWKGRQLGTTLAVVATDAPLTVSQTKRLAVMASAGMARALTVAFAPFDGDAVFALSLSNKPLQLEAQTLTELGVVAGNSVARALARGVYHASALQTSPEVRAWSDLFVGRVG